MTAVLTDSSHRTTVRWARRGALPSSARSSSRAPGAQTGPGSWRKPCGSLRETGVSGRTNRAFQSGVRRGQAGQEGQGGQEGQKCHGRGFRRVRKVRGQGQGGRGGGGHKSLELEKMRNWNQSGTVTSQELDPIRNWDQSRTVTSLGLELVWNWNQSATGTNQELKPITSRHPGMIHDQLLWKTSQPKVT